MKLPGQHRIGVQSLGRQDIYGPQRVANAQAQAAAAKAQASQAWGKAFDGVASAIGGLMDDQDDAKALLMLRDRTISDKQSLAETSTYLQNNTVINLEDESTPAAIRSYGLRYIEQQEDPGNYDPTRIKTHEIMDGALQEHFTLTSTESLEALKATGLGHKYLETMTPQWTSAVTKGAEAKISMRQAELKADADQLYQTHIVDLDEEGALEAIEQNVQSGAWTPEYATEKLNALGPTIDYMALEGGIADATEQFQLEELEMRADSSRLLPDQRLKINNALRQRQEFIQGQADRAQKRTYETGVAMLANGELTKDWVAQQAADHQLSGGAANTLLSSLSKPAPLTSDVRTMDELRGEIAGLRFPDRDSGVPVTEQYQRVAAKLTAAYTGVTAYGQELPKALTGADYADLLKELESVRDIALGEGGQRYGKAEDQIRSLTGYTGFLSGLDGTFPQRAAYNDFIGALQQYMDYEGANAKPMQFVRENAATYAPAAYEVQFNQRFVRKYPEFKDFYQNGDIDATGLMLEARRQRDAALLPAYKYESMKSELMYRLRIEKMRDEGTDGGLSE